MNNNNSEKNSKSLAEEIQESLKEMDLYIKGQLTEKDGVKVDFYEREQSINVKKIRKALSLTQSQFARLIQASTRAVQHWEQGTRTPEGPTALLLRLLEKDPLSIWKVVKKEL